jgi:hypothetical protein
MDVEEFLTHVRRLVVEFAVGQVLAEAGVAAQGMSDAAEPDDAAAAVAVGASLDPPTAYYLLHRHDFGLQDAPAGPCILYALSCGTEVKDLADRFDLLARTGGRDASEDDTEGEGEDEGGEENATEPQGTGSRFRLKTWRQRRRSRMGHDPNADARAEGDGHQPALFTSEARVVSRPGGIPLIDQLHRLMQLWDAGERDEVDDYLTRRGLRRNELFRRVLQAALEMARHEKAADEVRLLERLSNYLRGLDGGGEAPPAQPELAVLTPSGGSGDE